MRNRFLHLHGRLSEDLRHSARQVRTLSLINSATRYDSDGNNISNGRNNGNNNNTNNNHNNDNNASNSNSNSNSNLYIVSGLKNSNNSYINKYAYINIIIFLFLVVALVITIFVLCSLGLPFEIHSGFDSVKLIA